MGARQWPGRVPVGCVLRCVFGEGIGKEKGLTFTECKLCSRHVAGA